MDTRALRQKILDLAIRGKLVPQDPNDEPASVLLERIREQKQQMVKEGKLKAKDIKNDTIIFVGEDNLHYEKFADGSIKCIEEEIPFELPDGWAWSRFGSVVTLMSGTTYPAEKELLSGSRLYVKVGDMNLPGNEYEISTSSRYLDEYIVSHLVPVNSVIFPKRGGAIATNKKKLVLQDEILIDLNTMAFTPILPVNLMYCYYWFLSIDLGKINSGSSVPQINNKDIEPLLFPVPPTFEQERIVQAIIPLLDAEQKICGAGVEIAQMISRAKAKILDLAIRGQLVPQNPDDEPASVLLERIRAEKEELIKQGKIKRDKKESVIFKGDDNSYYEKVNGEVRCIDEEIPFELPEGWAWCKLKSIAAPTENSFVDGPFGSNLKTDHYTENREVRIIQLNNIGDFIWKNHGVKYTTYKHTETLERCISYPGDIVIAKMMPAGRAIIIPDIEEIYVISSDCVRLRLPSYIDNKYIMYMLNSNIINSSVSDTVQGIGRSRTSLGKLKEIIIPLPPLSEQKAICKKIETTFAKLESIENSLC